MQKSLKTILLPTDFSCNSRDAAKQAMALFCEEEIRLVLLTAYHLPHRSTELKLSAVQGKLNEVAENKLQNEWCIIKKNPHHYHTVFETCAEFGEFGKVIIDYANTHPVDHIVMSAEIGSGLKKLWAGTIASRVVRKVNCSVITIPSTDPSCKTDSNYCRSKLNVFRK